MVKVGLSWGFRVKDSGFRVKCGFKGLGEGLKFTQVRGFRLFGSGGPGLAALVLLRCRRKAVQRFEQP